MLQSEKQQRGLVLDPRTKLLLMIAISVIVLGGLGSELPYLLPVMCTLPLIFYLAAGKIRPALIYVIIFTGAYFAEELLMPQLTGFWKFFTFGCAGILTRVMPGAVMGSYVVSTTTVSEFTAAMQRLHVSDKIVIPMSVMFRFFPTLGEEFSAISAAMRMRGISLGGGHAAKIAEYRVIPLMTCAAKIGEELSAAALTRGLGGEVRRTNMCRIGFRIPDIIFIVFCAAVFAVIAVSYISRN